MPRLVEPPTIGEALHQARVLAVLALEGGLSLGELYRYAQVSDLSRVEIAHAVSALLIGRRLDRRVVPVRYREGDEYLRRDVPVYSAPKGGEL